MIRVYILPVIIEAGTEKVLGSEFIHDAVLLGMPDPTQRKLIMDTTTTEHIDLSAIALDLPTPTQADIDLYGETVEVLPPDPDTIRAEELLATSASVISMPEMWELVRIFGRRLGYKTH